MKSNKSLKLIMVILEKIKATVQDKTPVILMGDFNTNITGQIAQELRTNGFANTTKDQEVTQQGWSGKDNKIIDHVLLKNGESVRLQKHTVLKPAKGTTWSDHYPVVVELLMNQKPKTEL